MFSRTFVKTIARAFTDGEQTRKAIAVRCRAAIGRVPAWLHALIGEYTASFAVAPRAREVVRLLRAWEPAIADSLPPGSRAPTLVRGLVTEPEMRERWPVPPIVTAGDLADWLSLTPAELEWFADLKGLNHRSGEPRLGHYHYRVLQKRSGGRRLIEAPKPNLKAIQRRILDHMLALVPAHPCSHGFLRKRSIRTFAAPHTGQEVVLRMDLEDFFPSISRARVQGLFRTIGYPERVADLLGGLCTNITPRRIFEEMNHPHLPQGAPTSPAIANLCAFHADCRLAGLAKSAGATYTRYGDDLAFSGEEFARGARRFSIHAAAILLDEGFEVNHRKTRVMRAGVRQKIAGVVVNERVNVPREDFDRLKAILTNCARLGPASQNRDGHADFRAHLLGRISFVAMVNPARGAKLRAIFDRIDWPTSE